LEIKTLEVTRYIIPLREGGSLPALVEASDSKKYVLKFKGAGQGPKALIAEFIGTELARRLGFLVPEIVFATLDEGFGQTEGDEEIQDLLKFSVGLNLGMAYLQGAITYDPVVTKVNEIVASMIVWIDTYITNVDRTFRNTNMLMWQNELWLIDHGASLYFHHNWDNWQGHWEKPFPLIKNHVLLPQASKLNEANEILKSEINEAFLHDLIHQLPDEWLVPREGYETSEAIKEVYMTYLLERLHRADTFTKEIQDAR
jgi:hypothetical protein